ncbi:MAG: ATP-binding protein [Pseudomonadota bacterium]
MKPLPQDNFVFWRSSVDVVVLSADADTRELLAKAILSSNQLAAAIHHAESTERVGEQLASDRVGAVVAEVDPRETESIQAVIDAVAPFPVIAVSADPSDRVARQILALGVQEYVCLGELDHEDLGRCVRYAIERQVLHVRLVDRLNELERTKMRFQSLITDNADALVIVAGDGTIQFANPAAERLLQQSVNELVGSNLGVPIGNDDEVEFELISKDRRQMTLSARFMLTLWEGERAHIVTLRDITDRKTAVQALEQAKQFAEETSRAKSQFLANMSHELRTPLNSILGFSEMIGLETFGELGHPQYKSYAGNIRDAGSHLLDLINDLLDLSKVEAGRLELDETAFDAVAVTRQIVASLKPKADEARLHLEARSRLAGTLLYADERKFRQVLLNLVSNAIKFTPAGGQVSINHFLRSNGSMVVSVTDSGVGMTEEQIPKALEAFGQIKDSYTRQAGDGTGLGLALSKELVEIHDGQLEIKSRVMKGTTVKIILPPDRTKSAANQPRQRPFRRLQARRKQSL